MGLIHKEDRVEKCWLDVNEEGDIVVTYILLGPPVRLKGKGVKITVIDA